MVTDALIHSCSNQKLRYYYVPNTLHTGPYDYKDELMLASFALCGLKVLLCVCLRESRESAEGNEGSSRAAKIQRIRIMDERFTYSNLLPRTATADGHSR